MDYIKVTRKKRQSGDYSDSIYLARCMSEIQETIKNLVGEESYILMSHESAGFYEQLYTHTYPEEVESVIGLNSDEELQIIKELFVNRYNGINVADEKIYYYDNCMEVKDRKYAKDLPIKMFLSYTDTKKLSKQGYDWKQLHEDLFDNEEIQSITVLVSNGSIVYTDPYMLQEKIKLYIK